MFEKNKVLQKAINTLYEQLKEEQYGKKFSWKTLRIMIGEEGQEMTQDNLYYVVNKAGLLLMGNDQKFLMSIYKYGKRIINPREHTIIAKKTISKSVKIYRKAGQVLASTNMDKLTKEQKTDVIESANKYKTLEMFATEIIKRKKIGVRKEEDIKNASIFLDTIKMFTKEE